LAEDAILTPEHVALMTPQQTADYLHIKLRRLMREGIGRDGIPYIRLGDHSNVFRFRKADVAPGSKRRSVRASTARSSAGLQGRRLRRLGARSGRRSEGGHNEAVWMGRAAVLENRLGRKPLQGSNPCPPALTSLLRLLAACRPLRMSPAPRRSMASS
jgi:hypothetical protein